MDICVFGKYKVKFTNKYSYISDYYDREPVYSMDTEHFTKVMDGYDLLQLVTNLLQDHETIDISSTKSTITITQFNVHNGTDNNIVIKYSPVTQ